MLERVLKGTPKFYLWLSFLLCIIGYAFIVYVFQLCYGLKITGLSRNISWGFYIAQFTYLVGVAAGAVMLVLPAYFHHYKPFKRVIIFGEFLAIGAVVMCMLFIVVDMGQPQRVLNMFLHPTPNSVMFWDATVLLGYLFLNAIIGWTTLEAERYDVNPSPSIPSPVSCMRGFPAAITGLPPSWPRVSWPPPSVPVRRCCFCCSFC